jgi:uncharacterized protein YcnI
MSTNRLARRIAQSGVVLTAAGLAVVLGGGTASAHVTARVIGEQARQGGYTKITFRVPNEDDTAGTIRLEITFPADTPIASLRTKPVPGWTAQITKAKLDKPIENHGAQVTEAVSTVVWTANPGVRIAPGEFGEFEVSGGPLPAADRLVMPAVQSYEGSKVVNWDAPPPAAGAEEPEHPAPVIELAPAEAENGAPAAQANNAPAAGGGAERPQGNDTTATAAGATDDTARWLGGLGLAVGALGLGVGVGATLRARRVVASARAGDRS